MAKETGLNVLLKVGDGASPEVFNTLPGQETTTFDGSTNVANTTDKDNSGWQTGLATTKSGVVTAQGFANWGTQLEALRSAFVAGTLVNCQIVLNQAGDLFEGSFSVSRFNISGGVDDATRYDIELTPTAALTYEAGS